ncbi:HTTM domain-containing protein [Mucilaginibacter sp. CAU 1740]|uniref:HTTM domain-containing protein n=1 Tax=Mucilaginibacter sp. CAU 1740 TaxID=3140365 RepID=UPI00325B4B2A
MPNALRDKLSAFINTPVNIAPLAVLRMAFGGIMFISTIRFILKGWVSAFYIKPILHFTFYGFDWVRPLGATGMYVLFALIALAALMMAIGLFYRLAAMVFFLGFTYVELIDKSFYLNHYYLISVLAFLMVLVPANRYFSVDVWCKPAIHVNMVPAWCVNIFKAQLVLVYFFAGVSKLNYDWLIAAMPLRIWLPANSQLPVIGGLMEYAWVAYVFCWFGALFDLFVGFALLYKPTRKLAYIAVVIFHLATGWFFKIGMFPYIMILVTVVFFSDDVQLRIIGFFRNIFKSQEPNVSTAYKPSPFKIKAIYTIITIHFIIQLLMPFRFMLYPGKLYWTEEGYRFSWRVMLMEKGGTAFFHVKDPQTGHSAEIVNSQYLTQLQENMMATQPDMILQYAHFLAAQYQKKGIKHPVITAESYVTLNGSGSRLYIDTTVNLANEQEGFGHKKWITPFNNKN